MALWRIRATVDDRPGFLAVLAASLALRKVNILTVQVHATDAVAVDDFLVDAPGELSEADLLAAVVKGRGRDPWIRRSEADGPVDPPTLLLNLATQLVRDEADLPAAARGWLGDSGPLGRLRHGVPRRPLDDAGRTASLRRAERHARQLPARPRRERLLRPRQR